MQTGDMLRILLIFLGCFLVIKTILSLARRKLKEQFCLLWGVIALGLIISGICIRPTLWNQYVSTRGMAVIVVIGICALWCLFYLSTQLSVLSRKNQELAMQVSLLNQENEMLLKKIQEVQDAVKKESKMKQVLFVINTLGCAGAETAMIEMIRNMDPEKYKISVFVLLNQGEMIHRLPKSVTVLNEHFSDSSVLSKEGKKELNRYIFSQLFPRGTIWKKIPYIFRGLVPMIRSKRILPDKLLWRVMAEAAPRFDTHYDMAVAYLEGGSTYYVADYVSADVKAGFVHIDYEKAGYTPQLDGGCYDSFDRICPVSDEVKEHFLAVYPQYEKKTKVFHNMIDTDKIRKGAEKPGGFDDDFAGVRLLTVGRLTAQKAYEIAVDAMKLLKERGRNVRWYILGEGEERKPLEKKIKEYGLEQDFLLLGAKENPYPYYKQCDIYVHATRFEGKSIAIQEAQTLGCTILASDCPGNREQIEDGVDGKMCPLSAEGICDALCELLDDKEACEAYGKMAQKKELSEKIQLTELLNLMENERE